MTDLAAFILARIAEDEAVAQRCRPAGMKLDPHLSSLLPAQATHFARFGPRRVLPECEAKRQMVELHTHSGVYAWWEECPQTLHWERSKLYCPTLFLLAAAYSNHVDYPLDITLGRSGERRS